MSFDRNNDDQVLSYQRCLRALSDEIDRAQDMFLKVEQAMASDLNNDDAHVAFADIQLMDQAVQILQNLSEFSKTMSDQGETLSDDAFEEVVSVVKLEKVRERIRSAYYGRVTADTEEEAGICVFL